jgi:ubiquinone/menaquinone biosynthesis C-methylase UbiE
VTRARDDNPFTGALAPEYELLRLICPNHPMLARRLAARVAGFRPGAPLEGFEIGCGTGVSTKALLSARPDLTLLAVDAAAKMLEQARENLAKEAARGQVRFLEADALEALQAQAEGSFDVVVSNYATHNFRADYRERVFAETSRVLKPGGIFANGDRFAIDDPERHLALTQSELRHWFRTFGEMKRYDLLEDWVVHLCSDESPQRIMRHASALEAMRRVGFVEIATEFREGVDTLLVARKPD